MASKLSNMSGQNLREYTGVIDNDISTAFLEDRFATSTLRKGNIYYCPGNNVLVVPYEDTSIAPYKDYLLGENKTLLNKPINELVFIATDNY